MRKWLFLAKFACHDQTIFAHLRKCRIMPVVLQMARRVSRRQSQSVAHLLFVALMILRQAALRQVAACSLAGRCSKYFQTSAVFTDEPLGRARRRTLAALMTESGVVVGDGGVPSEAALASLAALNADEPPPLLPLLPTKNESADEAAVASDDEAMGVDVAAPPNMALNSALDSEFSC